MCLISTLLQKLHSAFTFYVFELTSSSGGEELPGCTVTAVLLFRTNVNIFHESFFFFLFKAVSVAPGVIMDMKLDILAETSTKLVL